MPTLRPASQAGPMRKLQGYIKQVFFTLFNDIFLLFNHLSNISQTTTHRPTVEQVTAADALSPRHHQRNSGFREPPHCCWADMRRTDEQTTD